MDFGEPDSAEIFQNRQLEYYELIHGFRASEDFINSIKLPRYSFDQTYRPPFNFNLTFQPQFNSQFITLNNFNTILPFFYNAEILNGSATRINDNLTIGGFSYGANSMMSAPLPNRSGRSFDNYGSTMFMQYKVSKNFKIETRVSVGQHQGPPPPPGF